MTNTWQIAAFQALLTKCLNVTSRDNFLVIYDESLAEFEESLQEALIAGSISATWIFLPLRYQEFLIGDSKARGGRDRIDLPAGIIAALSASTAIVNLIDATAENAPVRKAVNHTPRPQNCRLATIPGINSDVLRAILEAPTEEIFKDCEEMAWLLGEASFAEVSSFDSKGKEYRLTLALEGWENEPIMSPGVLLPGSWGNVPPGETFCCPPHSSVNGSICINGSVPGLVIRPGEEVVLDFINGRLSKWVAIQDSQVPALSFFDKHKFRAGLNGDNNWNTFAELGIGLNPNITVLTGNPLFDEKAIRTLHIAIGDNSVFGDDVSSYIHEDLVTKGPSLVLDGHLVIERGEIQHSTIMDLRRTAEDSLSTLMLSDEVIHLREGRIGQHNGTVLRRLSKAQRVNFVRMASGESADALGDLCESLRSFHTVHIAAFLKQHPAFDGIPTLRLLNILHHYRALAVSSTALSRTVFV